MHPQHRLCIYLRFDFLSKLQKGHYRAISSALSRVTSRGASRAPFLSLGLRH